MKRRVHVFISGHVQGVSFRANLWREANKHKVFGWVRNTKDNKVEAVFEGEDKNVEEVVKWCHSGPKAAKIENVELFSEPDTEKLIRFEVR